MTEKRKSPPSRRKILAYWKTDEAWERLMPYRNGPMLFDEEMLELKHDFGYCNPMCFACFRQRSQWNKFERAHIVPHMLGGSNEPSNFVLLCKECHLENPNTKHEDIYFKWISRVKRYYQKKAEKIVEACKVFGVTNEDYLKVEKLEGWEFALNMMRQAYDECGFHNGINATTYAGVLSVKIKECLEKHKGKTDQPIGEQLELF